jgi:type VI secretion system secreted protein VgrG
METGVTTVRIDCDALPHGAVLRRLAGREAISELFSFDVDVTVIGDGSYDPGALLGVSATIVFERDGYDVRTVHGLVVEVRSRRELEVDATTFSLRIAPHVIRTTLFETQEIFLDVSVPDVVSQKFAAIDLGDHLELRLREQHAKREFIVQYKESDFAFVSRLAEHAGLSFFFEHHTGKDRLVLTDVEGFPRLEHDVAFLGRGYRRGGVWRLDTRTRLIPAVYVMQEWNYRTPLVDLTAAHESTCGTTGGVVEFGAHYKTPEEGLALAKIRAKEREAGHKVHEGESDVAELEAGRVVDVDGTQLLVVAVTHEITQAVGLHGGADASRYTNRFTAVDASVGYRPPRRTPRPRIHGVTTGIIVDEQGDDRGKLAKIDEHGRYLVRLLFDTAGSGQRRASRPIRMAQPLSGEGYGVHFPLRPGTEVLVAFVDGDPDRPIVVGSVPNHATPSPVVRGNALESRIKTESGILIQLTDR